MGRIIINPSFSEEDIDKMTTKCAIIGSTKECICEEFVKSGKIGLCAGGRYFREPDLKPFIKN